MRGLSMSVIPLAYRQQAKRADKNNDDILSRKEFRNFETNVINQVGFETYRYTVLSYAIKQLSVDVTPEVSPFRPNLKTPYSQ
jgi:hypothetical protein